MAHSHIEEKLGIVFTMSAHVKIKQDYMLQINLLLIKIDQVMKDKFGINHVPILFEGESGETVRRKMLEQFDVHTLLRLPTGIFYAGGVKVNVLFFNKKPARTDGKAWTEKLWIYDLRTN